jgi:hypothetical protein
MWLGILASSVQAAFFHPHPLAAAYPWLVGFMVVGVIY